MVNFRTEVQEMLEGLRADGQDAAADHLEEVVIPLFRDSDDSVMMASANLHATAIIAGNITNGGDPFDLMTMVRTIAVAIAQYLHESTALDGLAMLRALAGTLQDDAERIEAAADDEDEEDDE
jgi:hypothetical protein